MVHEERACGWAWPAREAWPAGRRAALAVGGGWSCPWRRHRPGPEARRALSRQSRVALRSPRAPACWGRADRARGTRQAAAGAVSLSLSRARRRARRRAEERRRPLGRYRAGAARPRAKFAPAAAAPQTPAAPGAGAGATRGRGGRAGVRGCARRRRGRPAETRPVPRSPAQVAPGPEPSTCRVAKGSNLRDPRSLTRKSCLRPAARHRKRSLPFRVGVTGLWAWDRDCVSHWFASSARVSPGSKEKVGERSGDPGEDINALLKVTKARTPTLQLIKLHFLSYP